MSMLPLWLFVYNSFLRLGTWWYASTFLLLKSTHFLGSFLEQDPRQYFSRVLACMYHTQTRENMLIWPTVGKSVISQTVASSLPHRMAKPDLYFLHIPDVTEIWTTVSQIGRNIHMAAHNHNPNPNPAIFLISCSQIPYIKGHTRLWMRLEMVAMTQYKVE